MLRRVQAGVLTLAVAVGFAGAVVGCDPQPGNEPPPPLGAVGGGDQNSGEPADPDANAPSTDANSTVNTATGNNAAGNDVGNAADGNGSEDGEDGERDNTAEPINDGPPRNPTPPPETKLRPGLSAVEAIGEGPTEEEADWVASEHAVARVIRSFYPPATLELLQEMRGWATCVQSSVAWREKLWWEPPTSEAPDGNLRLLVAVDLDALGAWCRDELGDPSQWAPPSAEDLSRYTVCVGYYDELGRLVPPGDTAIDDVLKAGLDAINAAHFHGVYRHDEMVMNARLGDIGDIEVGLGVRFEPGPEGTGVYHVEATAHHVVSRDRLAVHEAASEPTDNESAGLRQATERAIEAVLPALIDAVAFERRAGRRFRIRANLPIASALESLHEAIGAVANKIANSSEPDAQGIATFTILAKRGWDVRRTVDELDAACARAGLRLLVMDVSQRMALIEVVPR